jgi:hypothetical protein
MMLKTRNNLSFYFVLVSIICITVYILISHLFNFKIDSVVIFSIFGITIGAFNLWNSKLNHESDAFRSLFKEFNARYDGLNEKLYQIKGRPAGDALSPTDIWLIYDYFNLCAEEYLYYRHGYIDKSVWESWKSGIRNFLEDEEIKTLWDAEIQSNSYYGLNLDD